MEYPLQKGTGRLGALMKLLEFTLVAAVLHLLLLLGSIPLYVFQKICIPKLLVLRYKIIVYMPK